MFFFGGLLAVFLFLDGLLSLRWVGISAALGLGSQFPCPWLLDSLGYGDHCGREGCCIRVVFRNWDIVYSRDGGWESQVGPHVFLGEHTGSSMPLIGQDEEEH